MSEQFMIGWGEADITPSNPKVELAGQYYQRVATGIHSRIKCVALAMKKGDQQSVEVTLDVVGMPASLQKDIAEKNAPRASADQRPRRRSSAPRRIRDAGTNEPACAITAMVAT